MGIDTITALVGSLGFPIVCCCGMAYYINTTMKEFTKTMRENTSVLEKLALRLSERGVHTDEN